MQISHLIRGVGDDSLFIILFKWPDGLSTSEYAEPDQNFLQTTGTQDGLTVELMQDGKLAVLGHPNGSNIETDLTRQDGSTITVTQGEVLSPDEAVSLFAEYLETATIDTSRWALRVIDTASDPSSQEDDQVSSAGSLSQGGAVPSDVVRDQRSQPVADTDRPSSAESRGTTKA
jgi:hypothetical protein